MDIFFGMSEHEYLKKYKRWKPEIFPDLSYESGSVILNREILKKSHSIIYSRYEEKNPQKKSLMRAHTNNKHHVAYIQILTFSEVYITQFHNNAE